MKIPSFFLALLLAFSASAQKNLTWNGKWYLEMAHTDLGAMRFFMEFNARADGQFEAHTRKTALKDILGARKAFLAKTMASGFKGGSLLRIENGSYTALGDTVRFKGILTSAIGNYRVDGIWAADKLSATLTDKNGEIAGSISGSRKESARIQDYNALFRESASVTSGKIYSRKLLDTDEWKSFEREMLKVSAKAQDDLEMMFAFFYYSGKLPISHYRISRPAAQQTDEPSANAGPNVFLEQKNPETAYLKIASFEGCAMEMNAVFDTIVSKNYKNLIVDLRDNPGGSVEAGMAFATRIARDTFYGGVFLTQNYFNTHATLPTVSEYEQFPHFTESNYDLLMHGIHNTDGLCLKVVPSAPTYDGNVYILTNKFTGSTCEPIVYGFQQNKRAVIVGEKTAGAMLAAEHFGLSGGFRIFLPTADYYANDGFRIDQNGVAPNVVSETPLEWVMGRVGQ